MVAARGGTQNLIQTPTTTRSKDTGSDDRVGFVMVTISWMLDEGAAAAKSSSLKDWLTQQQQYANANLGVSKPINPTTLPPTVTEDDGDGDVDVELEHASTRQLAENRGPRDERGAQSVFSTYTYTYTYPTPTPPRS